MNDLQLSNDLPQIEFEINHYQRQAGESIFEIGRRLKHVKENDLVHGEFGAWVERIGMNKSQASKFIKIVDEHSEISTSKKPLNILYEIATLPESERTKEQITSKGEIKTPDEMTVRELRELKRQLKQKEDVEKQLQSELNQAKKSEQIAISRLETLEEREPQVVEKEVIVERYSEPEDYHQTKLDNEKLKSEMEKLIQERNGVDEKSVKYDQLNEAIQKMNGQLTKGQERIKAQKEVYDLIQASRDAITKLAPLSYLIDSKNVIDNEYAKEPILEIINSIDEISKRLKMQLKKGDVIDV